MIVSQFSNPTGLDFLSVLSKTIETEALVTPACPNLYISSCKEFTLAYKRRLKGYVDGFNLPEIGYLDRGQNRLHREYLTFRSHLDQ